MQNPYSWKFRLAILPWLWLVSRLPFRVLYLISDFLYIIVYHIIRYRIKIVRTNLKNSFPQWDDKRLKSTEKAFYHYLCDLILETIKGYGISENELRKRLIHKSYKYYEDRASKKQSMIVVMNHNGNWEWICLGASLMVPYACRSIYKPLSNKDFNTWLNGVRSRFGTRMTSMDQSLRDMIALRDVPMLSAFVADQNPSNAQTAYWTHFLNQETAFLNGIPRIAKKLQLPLSFLAVKRIGRMKYESSSYTLVEDPSNFSENEIMELIVKAVERDIIEQPECWLWSHRRWKHKRPNNG